MIIANPIFDVVFKRMMEDERVAKFFIGTLLEEFIETVEVKPQEFTFVDELIGIGLCCFDFYTTLKSADGNLKKRLVKIQKFRGQIDILRYSNYLLYQNKKAVKLNNEGMELPVITIYILMFNLSETFSPCFKIKDNYTDLLTQNTFEIKNYFIEKFNKDSIVIQVGRIIDGFSTNLEKMLSIFGQTNFVDDKKITKEYHHQTDMENVNILTDILHDSATNPDERKKIEIEQEAWRTVNAMFEDERKKLLKALKEKDESLKSKDESLKQKDESLKEKDEIIAELLKKLKQQ